MKSSQKTFGTLNILRILMCIAILLYHMNMLKGGFLAVCVFFVLSSYFACTSSFNKENFSILKFYKDRLLKIYLPLIVVVFLSIFAVSFFKEISWINLKPETTSVMFGYNNFWQLNANLDYFTRHINSPFTHLWYISILMQFELIFPIIFTVLKKLGDKIHRSLPCIILILLSIGATLFFFESSKTSSLMYMYYNTFARSFSLFFGLTLGFIHSYYKTYIPKIMCNKAGTAFMFTVYLVPLLMSFYYISSDSPYLILSMIAVTLLSCRLIDYGITYNVVRNSKENRLIKYLSSITYEIYLVQYPIIFLFQYLNVGHYETLLIVASTIFIAAILHFILYFKGNYHKTRWIKCLLFILLFRLCLFGVNIYIDAEDHTEEMKELESQLALNEKNMQERQEEYLSKLQAEKEEWNDVLSNLEDGEKRLDEIVTNMPIVGIGDSIMLGAIDNLNKQFPNGYFDAQISRTAWVVRKKLEEFKENDMLSDAIILNLGANGDCPDSVKRQILTDLEGRKVFWLNVTNDRDVHINDKLISLAKEYDNLHIIDWAKISEGHKEYFFADGIHLTEIGKIEYTKAIYEAILEVYKKEYQEKKDSILSEHEKKQKDKSSLIGNDLLLNSFHILKNEFKDSQFIMDKEFDFEKVKKSLEEEISNNTLNYRVIFAFDIKLKLTLEEYRELVNMCKGHEIYILAFDKTTSMMKIDNATIIDFYEELEDHEEYLMVDKVHLTDDGNEALSMILKETIK